MLLLKRKPKFTVEQIHEEFDSGEERILQECDKLLTELQIPTENKVIKKAENLISLGFVNSETALQGKALKENLNAKSKIAEVSKVQAETIKELKQHYPLDKFITVAELERICTKYELIHAPVANYIKDVPEKNVNEMLNRKSLSYKHLAKDVYRYKLKFYDYVPKEVRDFFKNLQTFEPLTGDSLLRNLCPIKYEGGFLYTMSGLSHIKINKSGLFIAAPKSHFNLKGLSKKSKFGFFKVTVQEVKDPVVFEYCINDIVRIVTKWGTEDDQSYLDSGLVNEILN